MKGVFLFWTILADAQPQKRPTPSPLSLFLRPILNHGVRRRPQDLWPRGKAPTRFSQNAWYCSNYVIMWIVCDMSICNLTDLDCKVFVFWSNRQHDQTSCRLVLLRVLSPKDSWGCRELAQANCEDEGWQFWELEQFQVVDLNFCVVAAMVFVFLAEEYPSLFKVSTCSFVFPVTRECINRLICLSHFHLFFNSVCSFLLFVSGRPWGHSSLTSLGVLVVPRRNSPCSSLALPRTSWDCQFPTIQNVLKLQTFSMICYLPF